MKPEAGGSGRVHTVTTPEGVPLPFVIAPLGDRCGAFLLDAGVLLAGTGVIVIAGLLLVKEAQGYAMAFAILAAFLLRSFYFSLCEANWAGKTVGKRATGLRVISRDGGPLTAEAVVARNLTREVELFAPLVVLLAPRLLASTVPEWVLLASTAWMLVAAGLPFFSQDRLRCGDLVAGTLVVRMPQGVLLPDLVAEPRRGPSASVPTAGEPGFTREQLGIYGIQELQVLEDMLRRFDQGLLPAEVLDDVAQRIRLKIAWPTAGKREPSVIFLRAFYRAQRANLEQRLLFGQRQEKKREAPPGQPPHRT